MNVAFGGGRHASTIHGVYGSVTSFQGEIMNKLDKYTLILWLCIAAIVVGAIMLLIMEGA